MGAILFILVVGLLIAAGVIISVRLYRLDAPGFGRFRRIRRVRSLPSGTLVEEEVIEEKEPIAEEEVF